MIGAEELYPIYGLWHKPFWQTTPFYYTLSALGATVCLLGLWLLFKFWRSGKRTNKPWQEALMYLDELQKLVATGERHDAKQFYLCITRLFKTYLYSRYGFDVMGKTDEEMILFLDQKSFDPDFINHLGEILRHGTLVKFANSDTIKTLLEKDRLQCIALIKKTIPENK